MTDLYVDPYSGLSGDMFLGALVDLGVTVEQLTTALDALHLSGWSLEVETVTQHGVTGTGVRVQATEDQPRRTLADIAALIQSSSLPHRVRADAVAVFRLLAEVEAKVHGTAVEEVHFHEVGAVDSIIDVVGTCWGLGVLGVRSFLCGPLPLGHGFVHTEHGMLPVPAPATMELLSRCRAPVIPGKGEGEMVTPTGAALVAHFGRFENPEPIRPSRVGYGFGTRQLAWPNAVRLVLLEIPVARAYETDEVVLIECNIDDMSGEIFPYVTQRMLDAGALDAWLSPVTMKKGRPGVIVSGLVEPNKLDEVAHLLLTETTTLGVRYNPWRRYKAARSQEVVETEYGPVRVKIKDGPSGRLGVAPEYEDCARVARERGVPLAMVYRAALMPSSDMQVEE